MAKNNKNLGFAESFVLSGTAAAWSKTSAAPIERVKLLLQNQNELIKQGKLVDNPKIKSYLLNLYFFFVKNLHP